MKKTAYYTYGAAIAHLSRFVTPGTAIYDAAVDWDICIILDSARADLLAARWPETLATRSQGRRWSVGSVTTEWLTHTFRPAYAAAIADTTLVTATPHSQTVFGDRSWLTTPAASWLSYPDNPAVERDAFAAVHELWRSQTGAHGVVEPATMADATIQAHRDTEGCVVAHWLQPHEPFIAEDAPLVGGAATEHNVWDGLNAGELDADAVWESYAATLDMALAELERVCTAVDATVLVTADHGNAFGEWGIYGHPFAWPQPAVRRVPWVVVEARATRDEATADVLGATGEGAASPREQLRALGYHE